MKFFKHAYVISTIFLVLLISSCTKQENAIDFGKFENGIYSNTYFNLKIVIPESWYIMDDESRIATMQRGVSIAVGDNENLKAMAQASELQNLSLLAASEVPPGSPVSSNPSLIVIAEKIQHAPGIKRGSDYHYHSKKLLENSSIKPSYPKEIYEASIDGVNFDVMELTMTMGYKKQFHKQYVTIYKGYALLIGLIYQDDAGLKTLEEVLQSIQLEM